MNENDIITRLDRIERLAQLGAKNVLDVEEASMLTGFTTGHLYRLTCSRQIPHYKKNRKLYFKKDELENWMLERKVMSDDEIDRMAATYVALNPRNART